jgi:hypothetical protein
MVWNFEVISEFAPKFVTKVKETDNNNTKRDVELEICAAGIQ